jgi:CBS domain containing-hemolysin-like protein
MTIPLLIATTTGGSGMLLVAYVLLALIVSFLCSIAEAVLLSLSPSFVAGLHETSPKKAALLVRLKQENVDRSLAAILTLNTIAHTVGALGAGAEAVAVFGSTWFGVFSSILTLMILFLSEIIPKTLGAVYWRNLAIPAAYLVQGMIILLYPLIVVTERLTRLIARKHDHAVFSRDEFIAMAGIGKRSGTINESESRIIRNLFRLSVITARDIMTPRTVLFGIRQNTTIKDAQDRYPEIPFSRIPVYDTDLDTITGIVLKDDLLLAMARNRGDVTLETLTRPIDTILPETPLINLLEFLLEHRRHITVVVDEYGGTMGIVTLEDVVETLLGSEVVDEVDEIVDMQEYARHLWRRRARALGIDPDQTSP